MDGVTTSHASRSQKFILECLQNSSYVKCRNYCVQHDTKVLRRSRVEDKLEANRKKYQYIRIHLSGITNNMSEVQVNAKHVSK